MSPSLVAAIGDVLERHMIETGFLEQARDPRGHQSRRACRRRRHRSSTRSALPEMQPAGVGQAIGVPDLPALRLVEMLTSAARPDLAPPPPGREAAAAPEPGSLAEYEARRCAVCGGRYPAFGFGRPLTADGGVAWACDTHRHEVEQR